MDGIPRLKKLLDFSRLSENAAELEKYLQEGGTLGEILSLPPSFFEAFYADAYDLFQRKHYELAKLKFALLTLLSPGVKKYWKALGATQALLKEYKEAYSSYEVLFLLDPKDTQAQFFMNSIRRLKKNHE